MTGTTPLFLRIAGLGALFVMNAAAMSPRGTAPSPPDVTALRGVERGQWELRDRAAGRDAPVRRICLEDPAQLLELHHAKSACRRFVVADAHDRAVVTYQCEGTGGGRTAVRVETPRLVQIESQGVAGGAPFADSLEARRTGECH